MPINVRYLFSAAMDVDPAQERLFNEVYDREHVPSLLTVPGVVAVSRYELQPLTMSIGGSSRRSSSRTRQSTARSTRSRAPRC